MAQSASSKQTQQVRTMMVEVARTQLAAVTAALKFWGGWVESADRYTKKLSTELNRVDDGGADSKQFVGRVTDLSREYLREMISLPNVAVNHFTSEMERISSPIGKRARRARAKN
jgi:hypothetical protein